MFHEHFLHFRQYAKNLGYRIDIDPTLRLFTIQRERQTHAQVSTQSVVHAVIDRHCHCPEERARNRTGELCCVRGGYCLTQGKLMGRKSEKCFGVSKACWNRRGLARQRK